MASRPRIALPTPTSTDLAYNRDCLQPYIAAIEQSGGEAVVITLPADRRTLQDTATACDGVLLPGSPADVNPARYGHAPDPATAAPDEAREEVDRILLDAALLAGKPVLGICYGLQSANVWRGGTLLQHLTILPVPHTAGPAVGIAHSALLEDTSLLAQLADLAEVPAAGTGQRRLPVNSSHHQAVGIPGDGLRVTARCPQDGVVEALESDSATLAFPLLAVQWHPERSFATSASSRALFQWLIDRAAAHRTPAMTPERLATLVAPYLGAGDIKTVPPRLYQQLALYLDLLLLWNGRTNLTAVRDPEAMVRRHFGESLLLATLVPPATRTLLDLGSGAGFPGLPIQLLHPELRVTLAESQGKKASFLREVVRQLGLPTEVHGGRAEDLRPARHFDIVALRAVDDMAAAVQLAQQLGTQQLVLTSSAQLAASGLLSLRSVSVPDSRSSIAALCVPRGTAIQAGTR